MCPCATPSGAIKATGGRGLQPAMDHVLENEGNPVPDLASVSSSTASASAPSAGQEVDDEDIEALKAVYGKKAGNDAQALEAAAAADAEPKVRLLILSRRGQ